MGMEAREKLESMVEIKEETLKKFQRP